MTAWRYCATANDAWRRIAWLYSNKMPRIIGRQDWIVGFRYPRPVGKLRLSVRSNAGSDYFIHAEVFEHRYYELGLSYNPETILDLGANIGLTAVYFGRVFPAAKIACVEPISGNVNVLRRNLELNGIAATVFEAAIDPDDGELQMEMHTYDFGHKVATSDSLPSKLVPCRAVSVPGIMKQMAWERIGLLKVDIEGHERILFSRNCDWVHAVDAICMECHPGFDRAEMVVLARDYGFLPPERLPGIWMLRRPK